MSRATKMSQQKRAMVEALAKTLGIVTTAAKMLGIAPKTHYRWMADDPEYKAEVEALDNLALDFAESKLHKKIEQGDITAIIFFLKTKGKKRGYVERMDIGNPADEAFKVVIDNVIPDDVFGNPADEGDGA